MMNGIAHGVRICAVCFLMTFLASFLYAQAGSRAEVPGIVDFSVTLKTVAQAVAGQATLPSGRLFVLDGRISEIVITKADQGGTAKVKIRLLSGEWVGTSPTDAVRLEDVKSYSCYVTFTGQQYPELFNARPPLNVPPGIFVPSSRVIVVVRPIEIATAPDGQKLMSFEGVFIRLVD
jgi:hypothetical protein